MAIKVIVDTSVIYNKDGKSFLGKREKLQKFLQGVDIIIPEMVIEEIKHQKRKHLTSERDKFLSNAFHSIMGIDEEKTKNFDIDELISKLQEDEEIPFATIPLKNPKALEEIKRLALKNNAPFQETNDRGFKDAWIYLTVLDYLQECKDKLVFFLCSDDKLKEALKNEKRIEVIKNFDEFTKYYVGYFQSSYFISRLMEETGETDISPDNVQDIWWNTEENWIVEISCNDKSILVEVDLQSSDIIGFANTGFRQSIAGLIFSDSFHQTHTCIEKLRDYQKYFSDKEVIRLIEAFNSNNQINWIAKDEDVKEFFLTLYSKNLLVIPEEEKDKFKRWLPVSEVGYEQ